MYKRLLREIRPRCQIPLAKYENRYERVLEDENRETCD